MTTESGKVYLAELVEMEEIDKLLYQTTRRTIH